MWSQEMKDHRRGSEGECDPEPPPLLVLLLGVHLNHVALLVLGIARGEAVSDVVDGCHQFVGGDAGLYPNRRRSSREVDGGVLDTLLAREYPLDSDRARGSGHPVDVEEEGLRGLVSQRRCTPGPRWSS